MHVIANQCSHWCGNPRNIPRTIRKRMSLRGSVHTAVAIRLSKPSLGVVLRAANQNLTIASGNCTTMYRWHGVAVTDEGLASPLWERCPKGAERAFFTLSVGFAASPLRGEPRGKRIATSAAGLLAMTCVIRRLPEYPGDCHTSDIGHWFAMTTSIAARSRIFPFPPIFFIIPGNPPRNKAKYSTKSFFTKGWKLGQSTGIMPVS